MHFVQRISRICPKELAILQYLVCGSYESKKVREFLSLQVGVGRGDIYRKRGGLINKYIYIPSRCRWKKPSRLCNTWKFLFLRAVGCNVPQFRTLNAVQFLSKHGSK